MVCDIGTKLLCRLDFNHGISPKLYKSCFTKFYGQMGDLVIWSFDRYIENINLNAVHGSHWSSGTAQLSSHQIFADKK